MRAPIVYALLWFLMGTESAIHAEGGASFGVKTGKVAIEVFKGKQPILSYRFGEVAYKPYVDKLCTPAGTNILRDSPFDHVHHHALMFAVGVNGVDFWGEASPQVNGVQAQVTVPPRVDKASGAGAPVTLSQRLEWRDAQRTLLLTEERVIRVHSSSLTKPTLMTWQSTLRPAAANARTEIWGRHYFGLGLRFIVEMDKGGSFLNPTSQPGSVVRGAERLVRSKWCAYRAEADGRPVTVALFDHPRNPRHPATWFTMTRPFAYAAATLALQEKPLQLANGATLDLVYGVALWDGHPEAAVIQTAYDSWLEAKPRHAPPARASQSAPREASAAKR